MRLRVNERCPFCGKHPLVFVLVGTRTVRFRGRERREVWCRVKCGNCKAMGPRKATERLAIKAWEKRWTKKTKS